MNEIRRGIFSTHLEQREFSLNQLLSQEKHQDDFASYLAQVNQSRNEFGFDELTGDEPGVKLAFAFKTKQPELRRLALDYLATRGNLLDQGMDPEELILDLAACDLSKTDLWGANFENADFRQAELGWADLSRATLSKASLENATLSEANLSKANLRGADLREVRYLDYVTAFEANFRKAKLGPAELYALNELDQKEGNLLLEATGLVRNESGEIIGIEPLPDSEPKTEAIEETQDIGNDSADLFSAFIALTAEEQETFLNELRKSQQTNE